MKGLYEVEVPVAGQETVQRNEAIRKAFGLMLVKVTGNRGVTERQELVDAIRKAPRYVQQYQYRLAPIEKEALEATAMDSVAEPPMEPAGDSPEGAVKAVEEEPARLLKVTFDRNAVERLLRAKRLPVWDGNRPSGLIWLGVESGSKRRLGLPDADVELYAAMVESSGDRGIPLIFPLMDLEDQAGMQVADIWGDFEANIRRASNRYAPDLIVSGRLIQLSGRLWRAQWSFYLADQVVKWSDESSAVEILADQGVQRIADLLAERFAPLGGDDGVSLVRLRVEGVHNFKGYLTVGNMLRSQGAVDHVDILFVEPDAVTFGLQARGGIQLLEQGLVLGGILIPAAGSQAADSLLTGQVDLTYRMK
ncbi:MAG: DUF2066 domain-containing protein [Candidatus Sedimenticola sp. (ex Thyasira tokunagai)]